MPTSDEAAGKFPPEGYLTTLQTAFLLGSSSVTKVYALVKSGALKAYRVSGRRGQLFRRVEVLEYLRPKPIVPPRPVRAMKKAS